MKIQFHTRFQEVDFCASFVQTWESSEKTGQFDFPFPIMWDYIGLITPRPQQRDKSLIIFAPFQPLVNDTTNHK